MTPQQLSLWPTWDAALSLPQQGPWGTGMERATTQLLPQGQEAVTTIVSSRPTTHLLAHGGKKMFPLCWLLTVGQHLLLER